MKKVVVVGSGAGGATVARELVGRYEVTVLEAGKEFRPFAHSLHLPERAKRLRLLLDERETPLLFPAMRVGKATDGMVLVRGQGTGGTTTIGTGNAAELDRGLRALGIDLADEFAELRREIPITTDHRRAWRAATQRTYQVCDEMKLGPAPLPKMGEHGHCRSCGRCIFGCPFAVKWDSRQFLKDARTRGAELLTGWRVRSVVLQGDDAIGVEATSGLRGRFFPADVVVLAAGGLGTPRILEASGVACEPRLFVDPVLCVAAPWPDAHQNEELAMPFFVERDHYMIAPYFDNLSYFFNRAWSPPAPDTLSLMIKLADSASGSVGSRGRARKALTDDDRRHLADAVELCTQIFERLGVSREKLFLGTMNAGHPGGTVPLTAGDAATMHPARLPGNVWVADASLFPESPGGPPSLTIMAMAKRVGRRIAEAH
ncbi:MAG TPA: GMC family oxidoreductase N-terminal domain-containing protein [Longimicrobiales bacterium]